MRKNICTSYLDEEREEKEFKSEFVAHSVSDFLIHLKQYSVKCIYGKYLYRKVIERNRINIEYRKKQLTSGVIL